VEGTRAAMPLVSPGLVRWLMQEAHLEAAPHSPLAGLADTRPEGSRSALAAHGLLDPSWSEAFSTLCRPRARLDTTLAGPDRSVAASYCRGEREDVLVGCWAENGGIRLVYPQEPARLIGAAARVIGSDAPSSPEDVLIETDDAGVMAIAAVVDALRARMFASMLGRRPADDASPVISVSAVEEAWQRGMACNDARWLVTLLRVLSAGRWLASPPPLIDALQSLERLRLVSRVGSGQLAVETPLPRLAWLWKIPLPACGWTLTALGNGAAARSSGVLAWRGDGPIFLLDASTTDALPQRWRLRSITGAAYVERLSAVLRNRPEPTGSSFWTDGVGQPASAASATSGREASVCRNPGCRTPLRPGLRFCTSCGTPVQPD
jgi:hypothetical protein